MPVCDKMTMFVNQLGKCATGVYANEIYTQKSAHIKTRKGMSVQIMKEKRGHTDTFPKYGSGVG